MREILDLVRKIAHTDVPVLIQGEIGTGKRTIAREIHRQSPRAARPLVHVVCGSLRESDLDEKLFGRWQDSSPRGADLPAGLLESSQHGTLFLDGVTQLPFWAQAKLLDALEHGNGRCKPHDTALAAGARVIASSTHDLEAAVAENRLYSGLYYHLNAVRIEIPPLRHRPEDLRAMAEHLLAEAALSQAAAGDNIPPHFSAAAWQCILQYDWPGNVLQLAAVVTRALALAEGSEIGPDGFAGLLAKAGPTADAETVSVPLAGGLKEMELVLVKEAIHRCRGNKAAAARALQLNRRTLYRLLEE
jgi:DNA-binding NtrC family response regulator